MSGRQATCGTTATPCRCSSAVCSSTRAVAVGPEHAGEERRPASPCGRSCAAELAANSSREEAAADRSPA